MPGLVDSLTREAEAAELRAQALRKLADVAEFLGPDEVTKLLANVTPHTNGNGNGVVRSVPMGSGSENLIGSPRGREAVRMIVSERPGVWTLRDLRAEMKRRGWFTSDKGVDVAVTRLAASGEARRAGKGRYEFLGKEGAIESEASGVA